jgi:hypothetical protein
MRHKGIQIYKLPFVSALAGFITSAVWFAITICSPDRLNVSRRTCCTNRQCYLSFSNLVAACNMIGWSINWLLFNVTCTVFQLLEIKHKIQRGQVIRWMIDWLCLTPLSAIFQPEYPERPPTMSMQLVSFITCGCESNAPFGNLQSRSRTHAVLVIGLYSPFGQPKTGLKN